MRFSMEDALPVLQRTPAALDSLLRGLPESWTSAPEGPGTWSPYDVVGHLIHGERTNWLPRIRHLLRHGEATPFPPFDRDAMLTTSKGRSLGDLLDTFAVLRKESLEHLAALGLDAKQLQRRGMHPQFGQVSLEQLLSTWVVHDLAHTSQIVRVMAHQYAEAVGPWRAYLSILAPRRTGND